MKFKNLTMITATCLVLTGCAMFNKGSFHYNRTTTIGQELIDLKQAQEKGLLSEEEYFKLKNEIMKGGPVHAEYDKYGTK